MTAVGGSLERERGCSRRLSDHPSRRRLRRPQSTPCRRASCCPRLSWPPCTRSLGVSLTMAVVCVRAAIRLDGRRAHELRLLAAMAQAHGGRDAVLPSRGRCPTIRTWSTVGSNRTRGIDSRRYTVLPSKYCHPRRGGSPNAVVALEATAVSATLPRPCVEANGGGLSHKSVCWVAGAKYRPDVAACFRS
jgi:hypothetical protein